jgi:membrane protease YdiL (CAAX protease family)
MLLRFLLVKKNVFLRILFSYGSLFFLQIVLTLILSLVLENKPENESWGVIVSSVSFIVVIWITSKIFKTQLRFHYKPLKLIVVLYSALAAICFVFIYPFITISSFINNLDQNIIELTKVNLSINKSLYLYYFIAIIVMPILEEIYYRKIILCQIEKKYSTLIAILISSLMFSIFHMDYIQSQISFIFGILVSYIYVKTRRIEISILLHSAVNLFIIITLSEALSLANYYFLLPLYIIIILFEIFLIKKIVQNA